MEQERSHDSLIMASIVLCVPTFFLCVELFWLLHMRYPGLYWGNEARVSALLERKRRISVESGRDEILWNEKSESEPKDLQHSLQTVWSMSFQDLEDILGFDASVYCSLLWYQFLLFLFISVPVVFLIPIYYTGESVRRETDLIDLMSLTNVRPVPEFELFDRQYFFSRNAQGWRLWFTFFVASGIFLGCAVFIKRSYRTLSARADRWNSKKTEARRTVLITKLLDKYQDRNVLHKYLNKIFPGEVAHVRICKNIGDVQYLWEDLEFAKLELEMCESIAIRTIGCCCWKRAHQFCFERERLASEAFYSHRIQDLDDAPAAVVLFRSMKSAAICSNMVLSPCGESMKVRDMPESRDEVFWVNLSKPDKLKKAGRYVGWWIYLAAILLISSLMTAIQGLANLDKVEEFLHITKKVRGELIRSALQGALPPAITNGLFALLPYFLMYLSQLSFPEYRSDMFDLNLRRYADMLIFVGFFVISLSSSAMNITWKFKDKTIWTVIGDTVPHQSIFFLTFTISSCFLSLGLEFTMFPALALHVVGLYTPVEADWAYLYGMNIYMFTICITFAVVVPPIVFIGCLYFLIAYMVYTYQLLYVYKPGSDSGGKLFPTVYGRLRNALLLGELLILAMLVFKNAIEQAVLFFVVTLATYSIFREANGSYAFYFDCPSLESMDRTDRATVNKETISSFVSPVYEALHKHYKTLAERDQSLRSSSQALGPWLNKQFGDRSSKSSGVEGGYTDHKEEKSRESTEHAKSE